MSFKYAVKSFGIRGILSSILIFAAFMALYQIYKGWNPTSLLYTCLIVIAIVAIINKPCNIKNSILIGIGIGIIAGLFFFVYFGIDAYFAIISRPNEYIDWVMLFPLTITITFLFVISSAVGMLISYFIRKAIAKKRQG